MLNTNQKIIKHKVGLLNLAEELGNESKACKMMGVSRDTFYRYQAAVSEGVETMLYSQLGRPENMIIIDDVSAAPNNYNCTTSKSDQIMPFYDKIT